MIPRPNAKAALLAGLVSMSLAAGPALAQTPYAGGGDSPLAAAVGTGFTYQGQLEDGGDLASGTYDFEFALYDAESGGSMVAGPVTAAGVEVVDGRFSVELDFGAGVFGDGARWLEIAVRPGGGGPYVSLSPRQELTPTPYALALPNVHVDEGSGFVAVGRDHRITSDEFFGVAADNGTDFVGMYVESVDPDGLPFYGYAADDQVLAYEYVETSSGAWRLYNGSERLQVTPDGGLRILDVTTIDEQIDGLQIGSSADDGVEIGWNEAYPDYGLYVPTPGVTYTALLVNTADEDGEWALSTQDNINAGNVTASAQLVIARVAPGASLTTGDVAAGVDVGAPLPDGHHRLVEVEPASSAAPGLVGVVAGRLELAIAPNKAEDGARTLRSADGPARAGDYVQLIVSGVADVNTGDPGAITRGASLTADENAPGQARPLRERTLDGMRVREGAPVIGTALAPARGDGTVPVFVNIH